MRPGSIRGALVISTPGGQNETFEFFAETDAVNEYMMVAAVSPNVIAGTDVAVLFYFAEDDRMEVVGDIERVGPSLLHRGYNDAVVKFTLMGEREKERLRRHISEIKAVQKSAGSGGPEAAASGTEANTKLRRFLQSALLYLIYLGILGFIIWLVTIFMRVMRTGSVV